MSDLLLSHIKRLASLVVFDDIKILFLQNNKKSYQ